MREIKYRGKNINTGEWVYGYYVYMGVNRRNTKMEFAHMILDSSSDDAEGLIQHEVSFESVGQFTGLRDKNGKEIYKGDILKHTSIIKQWERELFDKIIGEVATEIGMTYLIGKCKHGYLDEEIKVSNYKALLLSPDLFEVIGDIHNNPELLESEEQYVNQKSR